MINKFIMKFLQYIRFVKLILLVFLLTGCNQENVFNVEKKYVISNFPESKTVEGVELEVDLLGVTDISGYDSLIYLNTPKLEKMYRIVSQNTGETLAERITRGQGPNELLNSFRPKLYEKIGDDIYMTIIDYAEKKIRKINIDKEIILDSINIDVGHIRGIYGAHKYDNEHLFVDYLQLDTLSQRYGLMNVDNGNVMTFSQKIDGADIGGLGNSYLLATSPAFNSKSKKYAAAMMFLSQINIIDINNPENSFCLMTSDYNLTMSQVAKSSDRKRFYTDIDSDENLIYALTQAGQQNGRALHVLDWDGKPKIEIRINEPIERIYLNSKTKTLYGITYNENLYVYNLNL